MGRRTARTRALTRPAHDPVGDAVIAQDPDSFTGEERLRLLAMTRWAFEGKRPEDLGSWKLDPARAETWLRHLGMLAIGVQRKAMIDAMDAASHPLHKQIGLLASRDALNRLLGRPTEKVAVQSRVHVVFEGLRPDVFPTKPKDSQVEIVDIAGDTGTE